MAEPGLLRSLATGLGLGTVQEGDLARLADPDFSLSVSVEDFHLQRQQQHDSFSGHEGSVGSPADEWDEKEKAGAGEGRGWKAATPASPACDLEEGSVSLSLPGSFGDYSGDEDESSSSRLPVGSTRWAPLEVGAGAPPGLLASLQQQLQSLMSETRALDNKVCMCHILGSLAAEPRR